MTDGRPEPAALAASAEARHRVDVRAVDATRFEAARERVASGLEWGVGALVTDGAGRVLLVHEDGRWLLPGGEVEPDETLEEALVREVREETGLAVAVGELLAVTEQAVVHDDERVEFRFAIYRGHPETTELGADPAAGDESVDAVAWVEELPPETLDRALLRDLLGW